MAQVVDLTCQDFTAKSLKSAQEHLSAAFYIEDELFIAEVTSTYSNAEEHLKTWLHVFQTNPEQISDGTEAIFVEAKIVNRGAKHHHSNWNTKIAVAVVVPVGVLVLGVVVAWIVRRNRIGRIHPGHTRL